MFAVFKGKTLPAVKYIGTEHMDIYPEWFRSYVMSDWDWYVDDGVYVFDMDEEFPRNSTNKPWFLTPNASTVLYSKSDGDIEDLGEYIIVSNEAFDSVYKMVGPFTAARHEDTVECYFWDANKPLPPKPKWMEWLIIGGDIYGKKVAPGTYVTTFNSYDGEIAMSSQCVFIRSKSGDIKYLEPDMFNKFFDTFEGVEAI